MRNVAWNAGNISFFKMQGISAELQGAAVAVAHADFQAVVEVEAAAGYVRYFPVIPGKQEGGEVQGKEVVTVFNDDFLGLWHGNIPFCVFVQIDS